MLVLLASVNITNRFEKSDLRALYHHSQASNGRVILDCITLCDFVAVFYRFLLRPWQSEKMPKDKNSHV